MKELSYLEADPEIVAKMTGTSVLDSFDEEHLVGLLKTSRIRSYGPGERIIEDGALDTLIYMLISGKVRVEKKGLDLCVLERSGDIFGEMAVITGSPRSASVYAVEDCRCLAMDASFMFTLSDTEKVLFICALFRIFVEVLTKRLKIMNEKLAQLNLEWSVW
ncbi:MAG: cyclic nucleotide-binding domain-containing protein [Deltaproteobacteria bacterium]